MAGFQFFWDFWKRDGTGALSEVTAFSRRGSHLMSTIERTSDPLDQRARGWGKEEEMTSEVASFNLDHLALSLPILTGKKAGVGPLQIMFRN